MLTFPPKVSLSSRTGMPPSRSPPLKVLLSSQAGVHPSRPLPSLFPPRNSSYCMQWGLSSTLLPRSHFPVPSACWERVWVSLPLSLRVPNKASRRSNCFSFLNCVVLLNSHFQSQDTGMEVRGFRSSFSKEQAHQARRPLSTQQLGGQGRTEGQRQITCCQKFLMWS